MVWKSWTGSEWSGLCFRDIEYLWTFFHGSKELLQSLIIEFRRETLRILRPQADQVTYTISEFLNIVVTRCEFFTIHVLFHRHRWKHGYFERSVPNTGYVQKFSDVVHNLVYLRPWDWQSFSLKFDIIRPYGKSWLLGKKLIKIRYLGNKGSMIRILFSFFIPHRGLNIIKRWDLNCLNTSGGLLVSYLFCHSLNEERNSGWVSF